MERGILRSNLGLYTLAIGLLAADTLQRRSRCKIFGSHPNGQGPGLDGKTLFHQCRTEAPFVFRYIKRLQLQDASHDLRFAGRVGLMVRSSDEYA